MKVAFKIYCNACSCSFFSFFYETQSFEWLLMRVLQRQISHE
jgi:hypothetical protein